MCSVAIWTFLCYIKFFIKKEKTFYARTKSLILVVLLYEIGETRAALFGLHSARNPTDLPVYCVRIGTANNFQSGVVYGATSPLPSAEESISADIGMVAVAGGLLFK